MDSYDEDLTENPFFRSLLSSHPDLFSECVSKKWILCVPRRDSLPKYAFNYEDFNHHILKPLNQSEKEEKKEIGTDGQEITHYWNYRSLAEKYVELQGKRITTKFIYGLFRNFLKFYSPFCRRHYNTRH